MFQEDLRDGQIYIFFPLFVPVAYVKQTVFNCYFILKSKYKNTLVVRQQNKKKRKACAQADRFCSVLYAARGCVFHTVSPLNAVCYLAFSLNTLETLDRKTEQERSFLLVRQETSSVEYVLL